MTRNRFSTPRSMSMMKPIPAQPLENSAVITTMPGVRNAMYDPVENPGMSATRLNSWPNSSSQITGWTSVITRKYGWRTRARTCRAVKWPPSTASVVISCPPRSRR